MKNMKKFAALLLTAAMTVAMVGCGSSVAANTVNSKDDLPGKKIGVQLGTTGDADATAYEDEGSTVERYNKGSDAIQALKQTEQSILSSATILVMKQESIHMRLRREQNIQTENLPWQPMRSLSHTNIMMVTT